MKNNNMKVDMTNVIENINCNVYCPTFFKVFNSCPTKNINLSLENLEEISYMIFSISPYITSIFILFSMVKYKTTRLFLIVVMCFIQNFIIEVLKNALRDPRPNYLCSKQFGNPSNHAVFFSSFLGWNIMEFFFLEKKHQNKSFKIKLLQVVSFPFILLSRYKLQYHTIEQLFNGVITGGFLSIVWFIISERIFLSGDNSFTTILSRFGVVNNMTDYEISPLIQDEKTYRAFQKYKNIYSKLEEMNKMKSTIKNFKDNLDDLDFIKQKGENGNGEIDELLQMKDMLKNSGMEMEDIEKEYQQPSQMSHEERIFEEAARKYNHNYKTKLE